jgi:hypothetical protein
METYLLLQFPALFTNHRVRLIASLTGEKSSYLAFIESLNFFNPAFKTACVRRPVQNHAKVTVKTYTRIEV